MRVIITGGAGYIGSTLSVELLKRGDEVVCLDNLSRGDYKRLIKLNKGKDLILDTADIRHLKTFMDKVNSYGPIDAIVHLAATVGVKECRERPYEAIKTNISGTLNVLEAAKENNVDRVILASTAAVFGNPVMTPIDESHPREPLNLYGITKAASEQIFNIYNKNHGLCTSVLRFSNIYGVGLFTYWKSLIPKFIRLATEGKPLTVYGKGDQSRDFIHVRDVAQALCLALNASTEVISGELFNIGSGEGTSIKEITEIISEIGMEKMEGPIEIKHLPSLTNETYSKKFVFSTEKAFKLGFVPKWHLREGISKIFDFIQI